MPVPTVTVDTNTQITVSFTTVTTSPANGGEAVTNYQVEYKLVADSTWITTTPVATSPKVITGLTAGASYNVVVRAENIYGFSGYSNIQTVTLNDVPSAP